MDRRIQLALDGELPLEQLSAAERAELSACEQVIQQALAQLPDPGPVPDVTGQVMWRIAHLPTPRAATTAFGRLVRPIARPLQWLWQPRAITLRPASALALLFLLLVGGLTLSRRQPVVGPLPGEALAPNQLVQFRFGAQGVQNVALVGDFGGWNVRYPMAQIAPGVWATALPLAPGVYDYAFVVDGRTWVLDPLAPAVSDGFGGANSRLSVLAPERRART